jgi:hypothetical protein
MGKRLLLASLALAGCGANVVVDGSPGTTTTTTTHRTTTGTTSTTGTIGTTTTTGTSSCNGGTIEASPNCVATPPLTSSCNNPPWNPTQTTGPEAYLVQGGPPPGVSILNVIGCSSSAPGAVGVQIQAPDVTGPGSYAIGAATFIDYDGTTFKFTPGVGKSFFSVGQLGPVGQYVDGQFGMEVSAGASSLQLSGSFHICHVPDEEVP